MRVEFRRADKEAAADVVATAAWEDGRVVIEAEDRGDHEAVARIFRPAPVVVDDASMRSLGSKGESVIQPGTLEWFRAAAFSRAPDAELRARLVPEMTGGGWDPAAAYRTFGSAMRRLLEPDGDPTKTPAQPGERVQG